MQRTAGMTIVVKASGVPEAIFNGQRDKVVETIKAEMARQKAAMNAEMEHMRAEKDGRIAVERDRADIQYKARCALLKEKMDAFAESMSDRRGPVKRMLRAIEGAWAMVYAVVGYWARVFKEAMIWGEYDAEYDRN